MKKQKIIDHWRFDDFIHEVKQAMQSGWFVYQMVVNSETSYWVAVMEMDV